MASNNSAGPSVNLTNPSPIPPPPCFSDFQFRTIGQQPELLKRLSAANPEDDQVYQDSLSRSPSLSPDLANELVPERSSSCSPELKQPTLHSRLSLLQALASDVDLDETSRLLSTEEGPAVASNNVARINSCSTNSLKVESHPIMTSSRLPSSSAHVSLGNHSVSATTLPTGAPSNTSATIDTSVAPQGQNALSPQSSLPQSLERSGSKSPRVIGMVVKSTNDPFTSNAMPHLEEPSLTTLHALQAKLSLSLANLSPVNTVDAYILAQSAKDQCTTVFSTAQAAHTLAQQALLSAQQSMNAARECLDAAQSVQQCVDQAMDAVQKIGPGPGQECEWNESIKALQDDLHQLDKWANDREARDAKRQREIEEKEAERRKRRLALQRQRTTSGQNPIGSTSVDVQLQVSTAGINHSELYPISVSVDHDADAATLNQIRQQSAERRRLAEEELRKRREAEECLEQEQKRAQAEAEARQAELTHLRAERIKAEEEERARQHEEAQQALLREQELQRIREENIQLQLAQNRSKEELERKIAEEKEKVLETQRAEEARLLAEQEQKYRDLSEKAALEKRLQAEKAVKAEAQRQQQLLQEQEARRREIQAEKQRANAATAAKIQAERKEKQALQTHAAKKSTTPPAHNQPLPPAFAIPRIPSTVNPNNSDFGNIVSKKTLISSSPKAASKPISPDNFKAGGLPGRVSSTSSSSRSDTVNRQSPLILSTQLPPTIDQSVNSNDSSSNRISSLAEKIFSKRTSTPESTDNLIGHRDVHPPSVISLARDANQAAPSQTRRLMSLPPVESFSEPSNNLLSTPPRSRANQNHLDISVDSVGSDIGNISVLPRSQVLPISPEAQKANLRGLMDANGIFDVPAIKHEPDEEKPVVKSERSSAVSIKRRTSWVSQNAVASRPDVKIGPPKRPKVEAEPPTDIPILSLPTPPPSIQSQGSAQAAPQAVDVAGKPSAKLPTFKRYHQIASQKLAAAAQSPAVSPSEPFSDVPATQTAGIYEVLLNERAPFNVQRNKAPATSSFPISPPATMANNVTISTTNPPLDLDFYDPLAASRMGPDTAMTDGWTNAVLQDTSDQRQRIRPRRSSVDHYSPSPSPVNIRDPRSRVASRRVDHYSPPPRRGAQPVASSYNDYPRDSSGPLRSRKPGSTSNSRGVSPNPITRSPVPRDDRRSLSLANAPPTLAGRKRLHDGEQVNAPPARRSRYNDVPALPHENAYNDAVSSGPQYEDEWSRTANYARSPTPEARAKPLALRMQPGLPNPSWNSYRPSYRPDAQTPRHTANYSPPPLQHQTYYSENSYHPTNHHRQNPRNDTRPDLLSRFTDSAQFPPPAQDYLPSNRPTRPRVPRPSGRGGANISRALINRLDGAGD